MSQKTHQSHRMYAELSRSVVTSVMLKANERYTSSNTGSGSCHRAAQLVSHSCQWLGRRKPWISTRQTITLKTPTTHNGLLWILQNYATFKLTRNSDFGTFKWKARPGFPTRCDVSELLLWHTSWTKTPKVRPLGENAHLICGNSAEALKDSRNVLLSRLWHGSNVGQTGGWKK